MPQNEHIVEKIIYNIAMKLNIHDYGIVREVLHIFSSGSPRYFTTNATVLSDPVKIWTSHQEELKRLIESNKRILVLLSSGLHFEGIIDRDTKTNGMKQADGAQVIVEAVREKLVSSPELLHKVLDVMDKYDLLFQLVARMRKALGFLQG